MRSPDHRTVVTTDSGGDAVATADVLADDDVVRVVCHVRGGHIPPGTRAELIRQVFGLPEVGDSRELEAAIPLGDAELLDELCRRCTAVHTRAAGATCLLDGRLDRATDD